MAEHSLATIQAACHCGTVRITAPLPQKPMFECPCSVCYRYGVIWAYYPLSDVHISIQQVKAPPEDAKDYAPGSSLTTRSYSWGKKNIEFHACPICHGLMYWWPTDEERIAQMAINTRMVLDREVALKEVGMYNH